VLPNQADAFENFYNLSAKSTVPVVTHSCVRESYRSLNLSRATTEEAQTVTASGTFFAGMDGAGTPVDASGA
jgi:hypothetical protein